ncbi:ABC transporter ATP-binding protein [Cuniculiplasma divulgatum]|uniref:ABC transporter ATP-binding protein n=1 Tax=Cuniculiplasma divulgatum TaxID=1673428 RepID=UPI0011AE2E2F|nr:ABC transporter ATP-binding protein [Cuniculiplasma divulgatum]MCI2412694.1 ABC transporter ATP-binding protein/permease [Cuniculiplasma sp.]WMT49997.1 MAG: ABC transporter ATP-binding protein [Thermoplasmatales archaeon]
MKKIKGVFEPLLFSREYLKNKKWVIYLIIGFAVLSTATRLLVPIIIGAIIDSLESKNFNAIYLEIEYILLLAVLSAVASFVVNFGAQYSSQIYAYNLRKKVVNSMVKKKTKFFQDKTSGDLLSRTTMDIDASRNFIMNSLSQLIPTILIIIFAVGYLFYINVFYSLFFLATVPILIFIGIKFQRKQRPHWMKIRETYGVMTESIQEDITGQRTVRSYLQEEPQINRFTGITDTYYGEYMEVANLRGFYNNLMPFIISAAATAVIFYGGYTSIIARSDVGGLVAAVNIFTMVTFPVSFLGRLIAFSENARAGIGRIKGVLDRDLDEDVLTDGDFPKGNGISMRNIRYKRGDREILRNIDLEIPPESFVCLTGETGTGKSSLVNLIPRLEDPAEGEIFIGGVNIKDIPLSSLRKNIAIVPQEISLLSGTISENIIFGRKGITEEMAKRAAKIARIDDFIENLPEGYSTIIGERGITLSGGQRQRVALARAIASNPRILILDDATSSVDPETELAIFSRIVKNIEGITVVLVSLRYSAMKYATTVYELEDGEIKQLDSIEELNYAMEKEGYENETDL